MQSSSGGRGAILDQGAAEGAPGLGAAIQHVHPAPGQSLHLRHRQPSQHAVGGGEHDMSGGGGELCAQGREPGADAPDRAGDVAVAELEAAGKVERPGCRAAVEHAQQRRDIDQVDRGRQFRHGDRGRCRLPRSPPGRLRRRRRRDGPSGAARPRPCGRGRRCHRPGRSRALRTPIQVSVACTSCPPGALRLPGRWPA